MFSFSHKSYRPLSEKYSERNGSQDVQSRDGQLGSSLVRCLLVLLALSISINLVAVYGRWIAPTSICKSDFAQLERVLPRPFVVEGRENTIPDEEWEYPDVSTGVVALTDEFVAEKQLAAAQRSPWDNGKGLYLLHGHHNMHCVKMLRTSILEYRNHAKQTQHYLHIDHCLTALREDVLCNADDTPRYTGGHHKQAGSGQDQMRMCRDWSKLDRWATEHSACYKEPESWYDGKPESERYKFCPDGSEPWKILEEGSSMESSR